MKKLQQTTLHNAYTKFHYHTPKRTFSTTSALKTDEKNEQLLDKLEAQVRENTKMIRDLAKIRESGRIWSETDNTASEAREKLLKEKSERYEGLKTLADDISNIECKHNKERTTMWDYIMSKMHVLSPEDQLKAEKIKADSMKTEQLFNDKILEDLNQENPSLLKQFRLIRCKVKVIHAADDKVEAMIDKRLEGYMDQPSREQGGYTANRAERLRERKEFQDEEQKVYTESISKLSSVDHIVEVMQCAEPDYGDIDE